MSEVLEVARREKLGKLNNRRLRAAGKLPAVIYGHGETPLSVEVSADGLAASLRHGAKLVELKGAAGGQALLQDVQWDTFQQHILHVDLLRVDAKDRVKIEVSLHLRGVAPGEGEGGIVEQLHHSLEIETDPGHIPDHLELNVNDLHVGGELKVSDILDVPEGAIPQLDSETVLVHCVEPTVVPEPEEIAGGGAGEEPEVIGRKEEEEGSAE